MPRGVPARKEPKLAALRYFIGGERLSFTLSAKLEDRTCLYCGHYLYVKDNRLVYCPHCGRNAVSALDFSKITVTGSCSLSLLR